MIVVGAPVHERGWILRHWFDGLAAQDMDLTVVMNYGPGTDDTLDIINSESRFSRIHVIQTDVPHTRDRMWNIGRYEVMTRLRNDLLAVVRDLKPDFYLSADTDMLMPPSVLQTLVDTVEPYAGIAPLTFMTPQSTDYPNWLTEELQRPVRVPPGVTEAYAVFGTVLMTPALYLVDYAPHAWGEDLGWAANVKAAGLRLAMNSDVRVRHVMSPGALDQPDERMGVA